MFHKIGKGGALNQDAEKGEKSYEENLSEVYCYCEFIAFV